MLNRIHILYRLARFGSPFSSQTTLQAPASPIYLGTARKTDMHLMHTLCEMAAKYTLLLKFTSLTLVCEGSRKKTLALGRKYLRPIVNQIIFHFITLFVYFLHFLFTTSSFPLYAFLFAPFSLHLSLFTFNHLLLFQTSPLYLSTFFIFSLHLSLCIFLLRSSLSLSNLSTLFFQLFHFLFPSS